MGTCARAQGSVTDAGERPHVGEPGRELASSRRGASAEALSRPRTKTEAPTGREKGRFRLGASGFGAVRLAARRPVASPRVAAGARRDAACVELRPRARWRRGFLAGPPLAARERTLETSAAPRPRHLPELPPRRASCRGQDGAPRELLRTRQPPRGAARPRGRARRRYAP